MSASPDREILNIEEAAALLGVSVKTFNKVLHSENLPARKIGREWKFSRQALIDWVGSGRSSEFYRESSSTSVAGESAHRRASGNRDRDDPDAQQRGGEEPHRRTAGWRIEVD